MLGPLDIQYLTWLSAKVLPVTHHPTPSLTYTKLLDKLYTTEFIWILSGDDNRAVDGIELRGEFLLEAGIEDDPEWRALGCSLLEMFIAFSRRAEFQTDVPAHEWFWEFLDNLGLSEANDACDPLDLEFGIDEILGTLVWRTFNPDGNGGIFPLRRPGKDQRAVEIWYQFCDYLVDQHRLP